MKHYLALMHSYTIFQRNNSEFAQVTQFRENIQKNQNPKKLNASIDFGQIQYQRSLIYVLYLFAFLGR